MGFLTIISTNACSKSPEEIAIEGYMEGLFGGDLEKFVRYSSYGYALDSMGQRNLANLFVAAESTRAKMNGGYQKVRILNIIPKDGSSPSSQAIAQVCVIFGTQNLETSLELVNLHTNQWLINTMISLEPNISKQFEDIHHHILNP